VNKSRAILHGYSPLSAEQILGRLRSGEAVAELPGDFVLVWEDDNECEPSVLLASSAISALPYFYYVSPDRRSLWHGTSIFDCIRQRGLEWQWNNRAVVSLALFQHTLGADTLHTDIRRLDAASILEFRPGHLDVRSSTSARDKDRDAERFDAALAVRSFNRITSEVVADKKAAISLSAGYDSRLLLSSVLRDGHKPHVATMGGAKSTDVRVASAIAKTFSLEHNVVELSAADYFRHARLIVNLTNGTKTADHWHTYLFIRNAGFPSDAIHLAGANGEFVRTYFFDKGVLALLSKNAPIAFAALLMKLKHRLHKRIPLRNPKGVLADPRIVDDVFKQMSNCLSDRTRWLDSLDDFYAYQRVRHFIGNGLALYNAVIPTRSPFLDSRFLAIANGMPRSWKLCSRFHRFAILTNEPRLGDFPVDESETPMREVDMPFYWLRRSPRVGYSAFAQAADSEQGRAVIIESPHLDRFLDRSSREEVVKNKVLSLAGLLIALHFAGEEIRERFSSNAEK
jgi:asparagine synthetase B (glutamine-hydrolysing)